MWHSGRAWSEGREREESLCGPVAMVHQIAWRQPGRGVGTSAQHRARGRGRGRDQEGKAAAGFLETIMGADVQWNTAPEAR